MFQPASAVLALSSSIALLGACRNENSAPPADPVVPDRGLAGAASDAAPASDAPNLAVITITAIDIDTQLAAMCGVAESSVFFEFDSAKVDPAAERILHQIATCAQSGPARSERLAVIGHAGPIGSEQYNQQLGLSRAQAVANYLRDRGIPEARLNIVSRGESGADELAPSTWPADRRVTIRLDRNVSDGGVK